MSDCVGSGWLRTYPSHRAFSDEICSCHAGSFQTSLRDISLSLPFVRLPVFLRCLVVTAGSRMLPDEQIQRFVFSVAQAVWAVSDSEATVRTLRESHRQHRLDVEMRREMRAAEAGYVAWSPYCCLCCSIHVGLTPYSSL